VSALERTSDILTAQGPTLEGLADVVRLLAEASDCEHRPISKSSPSERPSAVRTDSR